MFDVMIGDLTTDDLKTKMNYCGRLKFMDDFRKYKWMESNRVGEFRSVWNRDIRFLERKYSNRVEQQDIAWKRLDVQFMEMGRKTPGCTLLP